MDSKYSPIDNVIISEGKTDLTNFELDFNNK